MTAVIGFQVHVGLGAFAAAALLTLTKVTDEKAAIQCNTVERDRDGLRRDGLDVPS